MKEKRKVINKKCIKKIVLIIFGIVCFFIAQVSNVLSTNDPLAVVNNLSTFIFGIIRAIGMILLGWGIVQIGLALKSHVPSQRANGFMTLARRSYHNICKRNIRLDYRRIEKESLKHFP